MHGDQVEACLWESIDGDYTYSTGCGHDFNLSEDSSPPKDWMHYCCYCGKPAEIWEDGRRQ